MQKRNIEWIVLIALDGLPHEGLSHMSCYVDGKPPDMRKGSAHVAKGPWYSPGAKWYTHNTTANLVHVNQQAEYWRNLGYNMRVEIVIRPA